MESASPSPARLPTWAQGMQNNLAIISKYHQQSLPVLRCVERLAEAFGNTLRVSPAGMISQWDDMLREAPRMQAKH
jgi:hypothetical protein